MSQQGSGRSLPERLVGFGKDVFALFRDGALLVLAGLLLLFPADFRVAFLLPRRGSFAQARRALARSGGAAARNLDVKF